MKTFFSSSKRNKVPKEAKGARSRKSLGSEGKDWPSLSPVPSECHAVQSGDGSMRAGAGGLSPRDLIPSFVPSHGLQGGGSCAESCAATPATDFSACVDDDEGYTALEPSELSATLAHLEDERLQAADQLHHSSAAPSGE